MGSTEATHALTVRSDTLETNITTIFQNVPATERSVTQDDSTEIEDGWQLSMNDEYTRLNDKGVDDILAKVFQYCLETGWQKKENETVYDYLFLSSEFEDVKLMKWISDNKNKLVKDHKTYDVSLLCPLIIQIYPKLSSSLKESLLQGKYLRNRVFHERFTTAKLPNTLLDIETTALDIVREVCKHYEKSQDEEDIKLRWVEKLIKEVRESKYIDKEKRYQNVHHKLDTDAVEEMYNKIYKPLEKQFLPPSDIQVSRDAVFYYPKLKLLNCEEEHVDDDTMVSIHKILNVPESEDSKFSFIVGDPGIGKSSLMKQICLVFCDKKKNSDFRSCYVYQTLFYFSCREKSYANIRQYLNGMYSETTKDLDIEDVLQVIKDRKVLVLIDGLDELNEVSKELVHDALNHLKWCKEVKFIITCRCGFELELEKLFKRDQLKYEVFKMMPIDSVDEQINFLLKYQAAIPEILSPNLLEEFKKLHRFRSHFTIPLFLSLFCHLFLNRYESLKNITHEGSLMQEILNLSIIKLTKRLKFILCVNAIEITQDIVRIVSSISAYCLHRNMYELNEDAYDLVKAKIREINSDVPLDNCMSSFFQKRISVYSHDEGRYYFHHKSQQEFYTSKIIVETLKKEQAHNCAVKNNAFLHVLSDLVEQTVRATDLYM